MSKKTLDMLKADLVDAKARVRDGAKAIGWRKGRKRTGARKSHTSSMSLSLPMDLQIPRESQTFLRAPGAQSLRVSAVYSHCSNVGLTKCEEAKVTNGLCQGIITH